ncbi:tRNA pseudouridine(38-40) synthase TruA [Alkalihalobacillus oceani]|uniref:tRNA pseudouridine(38-40) synthase TruA n=1 Tax=Halalkalibacter oceani TaxID=1653776 RepID=UPI00203F7B24|nr:tRNA pseudouridine(38-40) synthase TruA [Halalkalibacter oceani]MCM3761802.1 tRNA pseudouridine(38-40) synthase TruA [Halalkalibacter oceani]
MANFKLTVQYDGSRYKGWQRLGKGEATIQGKLEEVLSRMSGSEIEIIGASRTDAGVHALEQIANVKLDHATEAEIKAYVNKYLPQDISVSRVETVPERFHARYHVKDKTYLYRIWNEEHPHPFMRKYSMHVEQKLDLPLMRQASQAFFGEHDFTAFSNAKSKKKSMVRHIYAIKIEETAGVVDIRIRGNGFLHNMVRKMVGLLIEVGLGKKDVDDVTAILQAKQRYPGLMAEAQGLYLEAISYKYRE